MKKEVKKGGEEKTEELERGECLKKRIERRQQEPMNERKKSGELKRSKRKEKIMKKKSRNAVRGRLKC